LNLINNDLKLCEILIEKSNFSDEERMIGSCAVTLSTKPLSNGGDEEEYSQDTYRRV